MQVSTIREKTKIMLLTIYKCYEHCLRHSASERGLFYFVKILRALLMASSVVFITSKNPSLRHK